MRIDYDELARILDVFLDAPTAFITLKELGFFDSPNEQGECLIFHLLLLVENGLISNKRLETGDPAYIGFVFTSKGIGGRAIPIRLTQAGYDFASALRQKPILERLKQELTDAPFDTVKEISKMWLTKFIHDRLNIK